VSYLLPQILRDLSIALLYFERLGTELEEIAGRLEAGETEALAPFVDLVTNREELDPFVSTAAEPVHA
jgi:hypothetical protein